MTTFGRVAFMLFLLSGPALAWAQPPRDEEWVPVSELPPTDQLPAAPLLVSAYVFVYVLSIARRVGAVQQEVARLESEIKTRARS